MLPLLTIILLTTFTSQAVELDSAQWCGGVVPHHLLVVDEIEKFWQEIYERCNADVIVLIGPDHNDRGDDVISTAADEITHIDHSITTHLPFIEQVFPNARVVPIVVRSDGTKAQMMQLADELRKHYPENNVLVVASVDFSHYQSSAAAQAYDQETIAAIQNFDYTTLQSYNAEHLDSDQAIMAMSEAVCPTRDCPWVVLYHGNSEDYVPSYGMTTSYFSLFLYE